jgi:hypothetical protein
MAISCLFGSGFFWLAIKTDTCALILVSSKGPVQDEGVSMRMCADGSAR